MTPPGQDNAGPADAARRNLDDFTRRARGFDRKILEDESRHFERAVAESFPGPGGLRPGGVAVDFGIGTGNASLPFLRSGGRVIGVELTPAMAKKGEEHLAGEGFGGRALIALAPAERAPVADAVADAAVCRNVFHHFENPAAVLGEMVRVLRPGGRVFVIDFYDPEDTGEREILNRIEFLRVPSHVRTLSMSDFGDMFGAAGLRLREPMTFSSPTRFQKWMEGTNPSPENLEIILSDMESLRTAGGGWWKVESEGSDYLFRRKRAILVGEKA